MPGLPTSFWMVSGNTAQTKAPLIRRYVKAFLRGGEWINVHLRDEAYNQLVAGYTKTDAKLIAQMVASNQPLSVDVDAGIRLAVLMKQNGLLKTDIDFKAKQFS
jgi:ABC-type nitrate/sulfonate/bicarbonate transport system substrate-binding protein